MSTPFTPSEREYYDRCEAIEHEREHEFMKRTTLCWNCSAAYRKLEPACPVCGKINANVDLEGAASEAGIPINKGA